MSVQKRAVFLDRDGVINQSYGFRPPNNVSEFKLFPGVPEAIRHLNEAGFLVFVVTNQGGVGLGYMTEAELDEIHAKLRTEVAASGGYFDEIVACIHKPRAGCSCRKPQPGMLTTLAVKHQVDLSRSYMIGDRDVDIEAGLAAGTTTILIESDEATTVKADYICPSLLEASKLIVSLG